MEGGAPSHHRGSGKAVLYKPPRRESIAPDSGDEAMCRLQDSQPGPNRMKRFSAPLPQAAVGLLGLAGLALLVGLCLVLWPSTGRKVVVYTALDEEFSRPVFEQFTLQTGIEVLGKFDTESTKTVGLTQALLAERRRPRCDLFWNNEIVNTLRLEQAQLLASYASPAGARFPSQYRSADGFWYGFAARARVLVVNTQLVDAAARPTSILDLVDPRWRDRVGIAKPLAGTTASHAACLFAHWGETRARDYFQQLRTNARVMAGNKQVALAVARGELAFGLTDTDDALIELERGAPVELVYPDQAQGELGTLFIPNTLGLLRGAPHRREAEQLMEFLLSPAVERRLAAGPSGQIPLNPTVDEPLRVQSPQTIRAMQVDFAAAADHWQAAAEFLRETFAQAR